MSMQLDVPKRVASFANRATAIALVATIAACADDASPTRTMEPATAGFAKNGTGSSQRILFAGDLDDVGNYDVYSMNADGTGILRLTNSPAFDGDPVFSPDRRRIAFMSGRDRVAGDIYVMNADGSNVVRLTFGPGAFRTPSWSKDGKQLVVSSTRDAVNPDAANLVDYDVYVMNADGSGIKRLTDNDYMDYQATWSPDGRQIAFVSGRDHAGTNANDLYVMNVDGTNVTRVTEQPGGILLPSWDPHSRRIAFSLDDDGPNAGIYFVSLETLGQTRVTTHTLSLDNGPSWSPDGTQLAYSCEVGGPLQVCVVNADGTGRVQLTTGLRSHSEVRWGR